MEIDRRRRQDSPPIPTPPLCLWRKIDTRSLGFVPPHRCIPPIASLTGWSTTTLRYQMIQRFENVFRRGSVRIPRVGRPCTSYSVDYKYTKYKVPEIAQQDRGSRWSRGLAPCGAVTIKCSAVLIGFRELTRFAQNGKMARSDPAFLPRRVPISFLSFPLSPPCLPTTTFCQSTLVGPLRVFQQSRASPVPRNHQIPSILVAGRFPQRRKSLKDEK